MSEQRICKVQASVMIYSDQDRRWFHAGETGHGASTISILVNSENGNSRIVAQKLDNTREVTVNMNIMKGLKYHQATKTFHQCQVEKNKLMFLQVIIKKQCSRQLKQPQPFFELHYIQQ